MPPHLQLLRHYTCHAVPFAFYIMQWLLRAQALGTTHDGGPSLVNMI